LDPNRDIEEGAQGNPWAEQAWNEYHGFIETAKDSVSVNHGKGFYLDMHGHGHSISRLELGYLISGTELGFSDNQLNSQIYIDKSSLRALAAETHYSFAELLRGYQSLGTLFEDRGIPAVPSVNQPDPGSGNPYFTGGYSTRRHGSRDGGTVSGVQIEMHYTGIRNSSENRENFAEKLTEILDIYFREHFGLDGIVTVIQETAQIPYEFILYQNYPNPFNPSTTIDYSLSVPGYVMLNVYTLLGEKVTTLADEFKQAGHYSVNWNADEHNLASGVYFYKLSVNGDAAFTASRKLLFIK
jgi:hypothetical protein